MLSTFSIVAVDPQTQEIGIAVQSKFLSVGAVVPWVRSGVGAVATQAFANTAAGPRALELLAGGASPQEVMDALAGNDEGRADRQYGIVDLRGRSASYTGDRCISFAGGIAAQTFAAQGNCLAGSSVVDALATGFTSTRGHLADRLVLALQAAQREGGDKRGQQSAALIIEKPSGGYAALNDRYVDLRVDDHPAPIDELARLLDLHKLYFFPATPEDVLGIDQELGRDIVRNLVRVGALESGDSYDDRAQNALVAFMHVENLENRVRADGTIDRQTLDYLRNFSAASY